MIQRRDLAVYSLKPGPVIDLSAAVLGLDQAEPVDMIPVKQQGFFRAGPSSAVIVITIVSSRVPEKRRTPE